MVYEIYKPLHKYDTCECGKEYRVLTKEDIEEDDYTPWMCLECWEKHCEQP